VRSKTVTKPEVDEGIYCDNKECLEKWDCKRWYKYAPFNVRIKVREFDSPKSDSCEYKIRRGANE